MELIIEQIAEINTEDLKLAEVQRDINRIRDNNGHAEITLKFENGKLLQYNNTDKKRWGY